MAQFVFGIVGIVFLGIMLDILYPNGKTNGFCKSIFAIVSLFVILKPIFNISDIKLDFDYQVDDTFVESVNNSRIDAFEYRVVENLKNKGFGEIDVEIVGYYENNQIMIENVYVDISSLVLSENLENINKYEVILDEITKIIHVDKEKVFIYG